MTRLCPITNAPILTCNTELKVALLVPLVRAALSSALHTGVLEHHFVMLLSSQDDTTELRQVARSLTRIRADPGKGPSLKLTNKK
jgi:hypothetical protein